MSYVLNQNRRGGCGRRGCGSCGHHHHEHCEDFSPKSCRDCSVRPDCLGFEGDFIRDPIFRGPCAPDPEPCDRNYANNIYATCAQTGTLSVAEAGGRLVFDEFCSYTSGAFRQCRGEFRLICGGTYLVFFKIIVPANQTLTTRLWLAINGEEVPGTSLNIVKTTTGNAESYTLNAVVFAEADDVLSVRSSNAFTLTDNSVLASIIILKVD